MISAPTPDVVALARRLYAQGAPVRAILAETGMSLGTLYRCMAGHFPDGSGIDPANIPLRRPGVRMRQRLGTRAALVTRMWRTAERQIEEIEDRLKASGIGLDERESNARTLAIVAKTLRELSAVDEAAKPRKGKKHSPDDDNAPRNIDEFRQELARRIDALVDSRTGSGGGGAS